MRGLTLFLNDLNACTSKHSEKRRVEKELAKLQSRIVEGQVNTQYELKKCIMKICYIHIVGYSPTIGGAQMISLIQSQRSKERLSGYFMASLLIQNYSNAIPTLNKSLEADLESTDENAIRGALTTLASLQNIKLSTKLVEVVFRLSQNPGGVYSPMTCQKAIMALSHCIRLTGTVFGTPDLWEELFQVIFKNVSQENMLPPCNLAIALLSSATTLTPWLFLIELCKITLKEYVIMWTKNKISINGMLTIVKIFKILRFFPRDCIAAENTEFLKSVLLDILSNRSTEVTESASRTTTTQHAALLEAIKFIVLLGRDNLGNSIVSKACSILSSDYISSRSTNRIFLGLDTMQKFCAHSDTASKDTAQQFLAMVITQLKTMEDEALKQQSIGLISILCTASSWKNINEELFLQLAHQFCKQRERICSTIVDLAEKYASTPKNYISVVFRLMHIAPDLLKYSTNVSVVNLLSNRSGTRPEGYGIALLADSSNEFSGEPGIPLSETDAIALKTYAASVVVQVLNQANTSYHNNIYILCSMIACTLALQIPDAHEFFSPLLSAFIETLCTDTKISILNALVRIALATIDRNGSTAIALFNDCTTHVNTELQQRSIEYSELLSYAIDQGSEGQELIRKVLSTVAE